MVCFCFFSLGLDFRHHSFRARSAEPSVYAIASLPKEKIPLGAECSQWRSPGYSAEPFCKFACCVIAFREGTFALCYPDVTFLLRFGMMGIFLAYVGCLFFSVLYIQQGLSTQGKIAHC